METKRNADKRKGMDFWKHTLNEARYVVAPMVEQSELAWRMLCRQYGAQLCYTPMLHAALFATSEHYRRESLQTCSEDRPLIVQFCANSPETLLQAAKLAEPYCDAIDLNIGCPQSIARRGHYGAFLEEEWDLLRDMVSLCDKELSVPITCKIRIFEDIDKSIKYAKMLESAGCQLLTVHGRTKEQKGMQTGLASWRHIKAIKNNISIPVFANGNIQYLSDVKRCLAETKVEGVMAAEGILHNPALFTGELLQTWRMVDEYLGFVKKYPCPASGVRSHIFKLFHHSLHIHTDLREKLGTSSKNVENITQVVLKIKSQLQTDEANGLCIQDEKANKTLPYAHWFCQPYVRPAAADVGGVKDELVVKHREMVKRRVEELSQSAAYGHLSKKKLRKLIKNPHWPFQGPKAASKSVTTTEENTCLHCGKDNNSKCEKCVMKV